MAKAKGSKSSGKTQGKSAPQPARPQTTTDRIVWWCLHATVFLVPLAISNLRFLGFDFPFTFDQFDIVKVFTMRTFALIGLAAWFWGRLTKGGTLRRTKVDWIVLAFLAWVVLTTVTSIHPPTALFGKYRRFEGLLSFLTYAAIFFLTVQAVDRPAKMRSLARTLVASGSIVGLYGFCQYLGIDAIAWGSLPFEANRPFATYGNPDLLGGFMMFPLPISLALALSEENARWKWYYWATFALLGVTLIVTFVRGAWIGGTVSLLILGVVARRKRAALGTQGRATLIAAALGALAVAVKSLSAGSAVLNIATRIRSIFLFSHGSARTRFEIWKAAWDATMARPITGFGADTFRLVFPKYKPVEYVADAGYLSVADNVHNYPLQVSAALGIPGFLLLYGVFVRALWVSAKDALGKESGQRMLLAGFWSAVAGYLVHLLFGLSVTGSSFLLWVSIGVLLVASAKTYEIPASNAVWRTVAAALIVVAAAAGLYGNIRYVQADNWHLQSKIRAYDANERVQASRRSIQLNPYNDMYRAELGLAYTDLFRQHLNASEQLRVGGQDPTPELLRARDAYRLAVGALEDVIAFVPHEYDNYVFLANLQNIAATVFQDEALALLESAAEVAERGVEVEPFGPAIRVQAGRAYQGLARYDEAVAHLEFAAEMDPRYAEPRVLLVQVLMTTERYAEAVTPLAEALALERNDSTAKASLRQLIEVLEEDPIDSPAVNVVAFGLAAAHLDDWTFEQVLPYAKDALAANPDDYWVLRYSALALIETGDEEGAMPVLELTVVAGEDRRYPQNIWATNELARIHEARGDFDQAISWLERGLEIEPAASLAGRRTRLRELRERAEGGGQ